MDHEEAIQNLATERYLLSEMTPAERESFEEHYFDCALCAEDLRSAAQFLKDAKELWAAEAAEAGHVPRLAIATKPRSSWNWTAWLQPQFALPAIAVLVVTSGAGILNNLNLRNQLAEVSMPQIVATATLRPTTRGDATIVTAAHGSPVVLQFDLEQAPASSLQFVVESSDDGVVFRFSGDQRQIGERVTLSIPRFELPVGRYTLLVSSQSATGEGGSELARYPLEVRRPLGDQ